MRIALPHGYEAIVDEADRELIQGLTFYRGSNGYVYYSQWKDGRSRPDTLHSLLMGKHPGKHIDHVNGDKLDNRRANLRVVSPSVNQANRRSLNRNNTSGIRGVVHRPGLSWERPWLAQITVAHKNIHLGLFATKEEARMARRAAELEHYGELCP